jgi:LytS/YehU family sensor histidine kinase
MPVLIGVSMVWLSPIPWRSKTKTFQPQEWILRGLFAFAFCQLLFGGLTWLDVKWFLAKAGLQVPMGPALRFGAVLWAPAMTIIGAVLASRERETEQRQQAESLARQAQSRALQSQMHPHALFNAINGLAELVRKDPLAAESALEALGDLLRGLMRASDYALLPMKQERRLVEDLLELESIRLGSRLQVQWEWPPEIDVLTVPPLLFQPMAENAIKHGIEPSREGGVLILRAERSDEELILSVKNSGEPFVKDAKPSSGLGLRNLKERLFLIYGDRAHFELRSEGAWTLAEMRLPLSMDLEKRS